MQVVNLRHHCRIYGDVSAICDNYSANTPERKQVYTYHTIYRLNQYYYNGQIQTFPIEISSIVFDT